MVPTVFVKWLHLSSAGVLVGAAVLMLWGVLPAMGNEPGESPVPAALFRRCKMLIHSCLGVLLLTGAYNFWSVNRDVAIAQLASYQAVLGTKMLLFVAVFVMAILLFRRSQGPVPPAGRARTLLTGIVGLCFVILLMSGYLNVTRFERLTSSSAARTSSGAQNESSR